MSKRGRPRIDPDADSRRVKVNLPAYQYDYLYALARRAEMTVPAVIRRFLPRRRRPQGNEDDQ